VARIFARRQFPKACRNHGDLSGSQGERRTDREVYRNDLHLGDLAEPLGFDSLWGVEHRFTNYTMCPDVSQYLTYFAGRTQRVRLGSMVVVLP
jgi:alkanesulfonate monooxygenase SsuD/methylene tetrahydromethanopterin reductase-like flavin-dependent oxidoreductase (luciferase family)